MTKVRLLAPWANDKGEPLASGSIVDLDDEVATQLHNRGQASLIAEEEALEKSQGSGTYNARAERPAPHESEAKSKK